MSLPVLWRAQPFTLRPTHGVSTHNVPTPRRGCSAGCWGCSGPTGRKSAWPCCCSSSLPPASCSRPSSGSSSPTTSSSRSTPRPGCTRGSPSAATSPAASPCSVSAVTWLFVVYLVGEVLGTLDTWILSRVAQQFVLDFRNRVYRKLQSQSLGYLQRQRTGDLMSRAMGDVDELQSFIVSSIDVIVSEGAALDRRPWRMVMWMDWRVASISLAPLVAGLLPAAGVQQEGEADLRRRPRPARRRLHPPPGKPVGRGGHQDLRPREAGGASGSRRRPRTTTASRSGRSTPATCSSRSRGWSGSSATSS